MNHERTVFLRILCTALLCVGVFLGSCDDISFREDAQTQLNTTQNQALKLIVPSRGLSNFYTRAMSQEGLMLKAEAKTLEPPRAPVRLGPLEQQLDAPAFEVNAKKDAFDIKLTFSDLTLFIPMRGTQGPNTSICRWRVQIKQAVLETEVRVSPEDIQVIRPDASPQATLENARVDPVGTCTLLAQEGDQAPMTQQALETEIFGYAQEALLSSALQTLGQRPAETLGLLEGGFELTHTSPFENRRGQLRVAGKLSGNEPLSLTSQGLNVSMDYGVLSQPPARCAPPVALRTQNPAAIEPVVDSILTQSRADAGLVMSEALLQRLWQAVTLSGFACRGLETLGGLKERADSKAAQDLRFADIGVNTELLGDRVHVLLSPGSLPLISTKPESNTLSVSWNDLLVEVYGDVLGTTARVVQVTLDVTMEFRIIVPEDTSAKTLPLRLETVSLGKAELSSDWIASDNFPGLEDTIQWSKRLMLLSLGNSLEFPLPLHPTAPFRLVNAQVRTNDVVLLLRFVED